MPGPRDLVTRPAGDARHARIGAAPVLLGLVGLAVLVRALGLEYVFVGDEIVFPPADPQYHLRRALYTLTRFPDVLLFDPYINHPGGAPVPWPPLFDFVLGALGRLAGGRVADLERVAAWAGPACAALGAIAVYLAGARLGSRRVGAVAALFFALLPISVVYTRVGNADHHAAVGMIGAWLLYTVVALADPAASPKRVAALGGLLFVVRSAMLLTWHGSLLYLAPAEGLLLAVAVATGRAGLLVAQAGSALASGLVVASLLAVSPTPLGGPYSSIALSRLHLLAISGVVVSAGALLAALRLGRARSASARLGWAAAAAMAFGVLLLVLPGPREGLVPAIRFLTLGDEVGAITGEQTPLFGFGDRLQGPPAVHSFGLLAYALPLAPLAGLLRVGARTALPFARAPGLVLAGWGLLFCGLAVLQRRYGNDAGPAAALLFATALVAAADRVLGVTRHGASRRLAAGSLAAVLVAASFWPAGVDIYAPRARGTWSALRTGDGPAPDVEQSVAHTIHRFAGRVREVTPETRGYLEPGVGPEYGVIAHANLGHALQYRARRATATDPFWWYIGRRNWDRSFAFLEVAREAEALALARALEARYVVTMPGLTPGSVVERLHTDDGASRRGRPSLGHFRLVIEAPRGGRSVGSLFSGAGDGTDVPYKLFEIVRGAVLEIEAPAGDLVTATLPVRTPQGRRFAYRTLARAGPDGVARLRVPYPTTGSGPAGRAAPIATAQGLYQVRAAGRLHAVAVSEHDVTVGAVVRVGEAPPSGAEPAPLSRS